MSTLPAVTMQDLELEQAELLPSRETLCCHYAARHGTSNVEVLSGNQVQVLSGIGVLGTGVAQNGNGNAIGSVVGLL
ncbi:MAG TPA: hypothetical protein VEH31_27600 [Streptosporangiaceae bacterium]|nr:hypothetical protein [Streptosporangiaceae bacterium]